MSLGGVADEDDDDDDDDDELQVNLADNEGDLDEEDDFFKEEALMKQGALMAKADEVDIVNNYSTKLLDFRFRFGDLYKFFR